MTYIVFATNNEHKLKEAKSILAPFFAVLSLRDVHCFSEPIEDGASLEENAFIKTNAAWNDITEYAESEKLQIRGVFADDTGLEIKELHDQPGVMTDRWTGNEKNDYKNIQKTLDLLRDRDNREARFRTIVHFLNNDCNVFFEGILHGTIATAPCGENGFGYDPIFIPQSENNPSTSNFRTLAQMTENEKNAISHRAKALQLLKTFLLNTYK